MNLIKKIPVPAAGLALGLAALGNLIMPYSMAARYVCGALSFILLLWLKLRFITDFAGVKKEQENPVALSVLPTFTMAWMLLLGYLMQINGAYWKVAFIALAIKVLWYVVLVLQFVIIGIFVVRFVLKFNIKTVFASWFITFVGFVVASVTAPAMQAQLLGQVLFYVGLVLYLVLLPVVLYRVFKVKQIPEPARPTVAIFAAPIGLLLTGYCSVFEKQGFVFYLVLALAVASYLFVLVQMPSLLKLKFYPSYSSFTFPLVICAVGFARVSAAVQQGVMAPVYKVLAVAATVIAVLIVAYVLVRYCLFLFAKPKAQKEA